MPADLSLEYNGGVGFRFQMGEWGGKPNFFLQTSRTLRWINLPPDLLELCQTSAVRADTVRHFALGPDGKWYLEHVYNGGLISNHSTNYLDGVNIDWKNGPIHHIEYGAGATVWGIQKKQTFKLTTTMFSAHLPSDFEQMLQVRLREGVIKDYNTDFRYAAFGKNGQWIFSTLRRVDWSGNLHPEILKRLQDTDKKSGILNVELSPYDAEDLFIEFYDKSTSLILPAVWAIRPLVAEENVLTAKHRDRPGRVKRNYEEDAKVAAKGVKMVHKVLGFGGLFKS